MLTIVFFLNAFITITFPHYLLHRARKNACKLGDATKWNKMSIAK